MRIISNTGDPIVDLEGNPLAGCVVEFKLVDADQRFTSVAYVVATGDRIGRHYATATTDVNGIFSIELYCNDEITSPDVTATMYRCKVNNSAYSVFYASLPTGVGDLPFHDFYTNSAPLTAGQIIVNRTVITLTADTTLSETHRHAVLLVSGNSITLTLPDASTLATGWDCTIVNENSDSSVTAHADGSATVPVSEKYIRIARTNTDTVNGLSTEVSNSAFLITPKSCIDVYKATDDKYYASPSHRVGWKDLPSEPKPLGANANDPAETAIGAAFMRGLEMTNATAGNEKEVYYRLHVNHDYVKGSKCWLHCHWNSGNTTATDVVRWGFQYAAAKGFAQQAVSTTGTTVYVNQTLNGTAYMDYVSEVADADAVPATNLEPDSLIHIRLFRDSANAADTHTASAWLTVVDGHYLSYDVGTTPLKAPPFYV